VCKSWAFATFVEHACSVQAVSSGAVTVADAEGQAVTLSLKAAKVDKELAKSSTGALASMWAGQEQKIAAAIRIQAMVRGSNARRAKKHTRRRSGAHG
jgi:tRNA threonylcarbamoyladenosine modification (KEOPS) complex Cgi121 subunit